MDPTFASLKTKKDRVAYIRDMIAHNRSWTLRALVRVYENQSIDEQACGSTVVNNGIGFTSFDAEFLTKLAKEYLAGKSVPISYLQRAMPKYARQLERIAK